LPYDERLSWLGLWSLQERRNRTDLTELFKLKVFLALHGTKFFHRSEITGTRGHSWKLVKNHCHCEARLQFFSQHVINRWNSLSQEDVDATSVNVFKGRLERRRRQQMDFYKDELSTSPISCMTIDPHLPTTDDCLRTKAGAAAPGELSLRDLTTLCICKI